MHDDTATGVLILVLVVFVFATFILGACEGHKDGFRDGQIAALSGDIRYELREQPDKSVVWVAKE